VGVTSTTEATVTQPNSGVSRWEFEQDVTDSWGGFDGTDNTSAGYTTNAAFGTFAKEFDTTDDYVDLGSDIGIAGTSKFSFSIWIYPRNTNSSFVILQGGSDGNDLNFLRWNGVDNKWQFRVSNGNSIGGGTIDTDQYQLLTVTYDDANGIYKLYKNDTEVASGSPNGNISTSSATWKFGDDRDGLPFNADLDDARRYNKALTSTEVSDLFNTGSI
jgi:hypothetical protein